MSKHWQPIGNNVSVQHDQQFFSLMTPDSQGSATMITLDRDSAKQLQNHLRQFGTANASPTEATPPAGGKE